MTTPGSIHAQTHIMRTTEVIDLHEADLDAPPPAEDYPLPLWCYVMHLVSHGIQQFTDAAVLLTRAGHSPGDIGFLEWAPVRSKG
jgi:hypothetical protein